MATTTVRRPRPSGTFPRKYVGIVSYNVPKFDQTCGCYPNIAVHYIHIGGSTEMGIARSITGTGAIPMLELEPYGNVPLASISSGGWDHWLITYARAVSSLHSPVIMSFAPEANGSWYSWGYPHEQPGALVSAWRHVVTVFRRTGVHDVKWAWIVNVQFNGSEDLAKLWPGDAFVNILGLDGYFIQHSNTLQGAFEGAFGASILALRRLSADPLLITETAAAPCYVGKAGALRELDAGVAQYGLAGFIWFDIRQQGSVTRQNWSLEDDPPALRLFSSQVNAVSTSRPPAG